MDLKELKQTEWYKERPKIIQQIICKFPPFYTYRFKYSQKEFNIIGYEEPLELNDPDDVTFIVQKTGNGGVLGQFGLGILDTNQVFGVEQGNIEKI